jgi:TonB-dependent SusC/RagA subfamily outer membrane receptor
MQISAQQDILQRNIRLENKIYELTNLLSYIENNYKIKFAYNSEIFDKDCQLEFKQQSLELERILEEMNKKCKLNYKISEGNILIFKADNNQKFTLSGRIIDSVSLKPLPAATLFIAETNQSTISNDEGEYLFKLPPGEYMLRCIYMGYKSQDYSFSLYSNKTYNFILREEKHAIQEVKVTSQRKLYGEMEKGRPIQTIESKKIEQLNTNNLSDILQGNVTGVWATKVSGAPGDHQKVRIRGISSLFGNVDPLYIVDGVPVPIVNLRTLGGPDLNVYDIDNVTVLKDASSTALYGYLGGNGVIIIDTKNPKAEYEIDYENTRYLKILQNNDAIILY